MTGVLEIIYDSYHNLKKALSSTRKIILILLISICIKTIYPDKVEMIFANILDAKYYKLFVDIIILLITFLGVLGLFSVLLWVFCGWIRILLKFGIKITNKRKKKVSKNKREKDFKYYMREVKSWTRKIFYGADVRIGIILKWLIILLGFLFLLDSNAFKQYFYQHFRLIKKNLINIFNYFDNGLIKYLIVLPSYLFSGIKITTDILEILFYHIRALFYDYFHIRTMINKNKDNNLKSQVKRELTRSLKIENEELKKEMAKEIKEEITQEEILSEIKEETKQEIKEGIKEELKEI